MGVVGGVFGREFGAGVGGRGVEGWTGGLEGWVFVFVLVLFLREGGGIGLGGFFFSFFPPWMR